MMQPGTPLLLCINMMYKNMTHHHGKTIDWLGQVCTYQVCVWTMGVYVPWVCICTRCTVMLISIHIYELLQWVVVLLIAPILHAQGTHTCCP